MLSVDHRYTQKQKFLGRLESLTTPTPSSNNEVGDSSPFLHATPSTGGKKGGWRHQNKCSPSTSQLPYPMKEEHSDSNSNFTSSEMYTFSVRLKVIEKVIFLSKSQLSQAQAYLQRVHTHTGVITIPHQLSLTEVKKKNPTLLIKMYISLQFHSLLATSSYFLKRQAAGYKSVKKYTFQSALWEFSLQYKITKL